MAVVPTVLDELRSVSGGMSFAESSIGIHSPTWLTDV